MGQQSSPSRFSRLLRLAKVFSKKLTGYRSVLVRRPEFWLASFRTALPMHSNLVIAGLLSAAFQHPIGKRGKGCIEREAKIDETTHKINLKTVYTSMLKCAIPPLCKRHLRRAPQPNQGERQRSIACECI